MYQYILKRIFLMVPTVVGAGAVVFFVMRVIPGDICLVRWVDYGMHYVQEVIDICRNEFGLNDPLHIQFIDFMTGILTFDFGISMWTWQPITEELRVRFPLSLQLALMATTTSILIAIPLGTISAVKQDTWVDYVVRTFTNAGVAMPSFWLGILIILGILIFSQAWFGEPWMPPIEYVSPFEDPAANLSQLICPAVVAGYRYSSVLTRMTRSAFLEVMREDYIRTARAKGMLRKIIINRHALRNAFLPVVTVIGMELSFLMGGLVVTEQVFNLNGLGRLMVDSVLNEDYNMVQALVMVVVMVFVCVNFVVDLVYAWLDPRIRYR
ncbi:MAG: ABC transporter permease [Nitrospinota bacterium]|nr:ABC transporter permease [Nitrospinota bacterium]MDP7168264.1 ABC transporter permease [Nitrospinota bacterium]MDP7370066.1 ABC transporter permease [Nitrospinota bacterium]MDP7662672.1 ABC transporter permease [Nitrospinota bacterium]HJP13306.1 ABC transporter permease [Nitrospinota bacterium]